MKFFRIFAEFLIIFSGVKTFGEEKFLYWREAAAGHNKVAYFIGKTICTFYRFSVTSLHFAMFYYILARPLISFGKFYFLIFLTFYCVYGLATIVSMLVRRENSSLLAVVICLFAAVSLIFLRKFSQNSHKIIINNFF